MQRKSPGSKCSLYYKDGANPLCPARNGIRERTVPLPAGFPRAEPHLEAPYATHLGQPSHARRRTQCVGMALRRQMEGTQCVRKFK